jgi:hypothetical protein
MIQEGNGLSVKFDNSCVDSVDWKNVFRRIETCSIERQSRQDQVKNE